MRFLHLADLHLGKSLNDVSMLADQEYILDQILEKAAEHQADAVLIAGDVYQNSAPSAEAMALFDRFLSGLVRMRLPVFIISGNHDSALRISYMGDLISSAGIHVTKAFDGHIQRYTLRDEKNEIVIHLLPFIKPVQVCGIYPGFKSDSYQESVRTVLNNNRPDPDKINILVCHQFITGAEKCDSEEYAVGGLDNIDASLLDAYDYVALGHIHKAQSAGRSCVRYTGSPLKYSFSEAEHKKSVTLVDVHGKGDIDISTIPLTPLRDLKILEGTYDELMRHPAGEDYLWIKLHDEKVPPDAQENLNAAFPNLLRFTVENSKSVFTLDLPATEETQNLSILPLFQRFYAVRNNDKTPDERQMEILKDILREIEEEQS